MKGAITTRVLPVAAVAVVLAGAAAVTTLKHPLTLTAGSSAPLPRAAAVSSAVRACPAPGLPGSPSGRVAFTGGLADAAAAAGPGRR